MSSTKLLKLTDIEQVQILMDRVDDSLTPSKELSVIYMMLGILKAEFYNAGIYELDLETANKIINAKRVNEIRQRAIELMGLYTLSGSRQRHFLASYLASIAATVTVWILGGLLALAVLLGNLDGAITALETIQNLFQNEKPNG